MATFPIYQPELGYRLARTHQSAVALPYYSLVKLGDVSGANLDTMVTLCTSASDVPIGVVIPEMHDEMPYVDANGYGTGIVPRTGYLAGEYPKIAIFGVCHVKVATGATVVAGSDIVADTTGYANVYSAPGVSASVTGSQVQSLVTSTATKLGTALDSGAAGSYVRVFIKK
jgi:hypothetical protein